MVKNITESEAMMSAITNEKIVNNGNGTYGISFTFTPDSVPVPTPTPQPPANAFADAVALTPGVSDQFRNEANGRKHFKFTVPAGMNYFSFVLGSYDQLAAFEMTIQNAPGVDLFNQVYAAYQSGNPSWGSPYQQVINGVTVYACMGYNNPYSQLVVVHNPPPGDYYVTAVNISQLVGSNVVQVIMG